ncbi:hypothetical protein [Nostoc sp. ChiQUE01b]|uniref:hypothetical protein n=1 Tax=Nostoc sp. ChiQUE01b TaxID=3075376 RepID=UPI002AD3F656|nr:hypothetical protein [Nostoc sp. ChiQUE01b]MDZ8264289.1 hypothetical protein [Nostoc sp. ChiQUE01b]
MAKPPRDDSDDLPRLKTGCKNFNLFRIKAIITPQYVIAFSIVSTWLWLYRGRDKSDIFSTAFYCLVF